MSDEDKIIKIDTSEEVMSAIAANTLNEMTAYLVELESKGADEATMMHSCVWPIIHEAARRFDAIKIGAEVAVDGLLTKRPVAEVQQ
tara:strand:- start:49921 stop:50181 length:261 start_codon:yes stop_codon:yes gene_type:complete